MILEAFADQDLSLSLARVSEAAAIAAADMVGRGDSKGADQVAVDAMRKTLNELMISGTVVIGEGERDKAPMLFIGEEVGAGGPEVDIALDPLEGTDLTANGAPDALAVIAVGPRGSMLHAPDVYMEKLAIGPGYAPDVISLEMSPGARVKALAAAKGCAANEITVCILQRDRHDSMIKAVRETGAAVMLIPDGDVAGIIFTADPENAIDMYMGTGGAPEGVLAAAALKCLGGQIYGRLLFRDDDERKRAEKAGIRDFSKVYSRDDMVAGDVVFAATGVTNGALVAGVKRNKTHITTQTLLMRSRTGTVRKIQAQRRVKPL